MRFSMKSWINKVDSYVHIINILYDFEIYVFQIDQILRLNPSLNSYLNMCKDWLW